MEVYAFHLMPWQYLPAPGSGDDASWITLSNSNFDPEKGQVLYEEYLRQLEFAEEIGMDGVCVNEHHQTAYGLMPSPNVMASAVIQRTKRVKVAILGNCIALRDHPLRVAEEIAMLDLLSHGRVVCGFVRGVGGEYKSFSIDPNTSLDRFREAHDLIVQAWSEPGPFVFRSEHYEFLYVNPWPRPLQQPHPPIWIPSQGSTETIQWSAERHYTILQTYNPLANIQRVFDRYRACAHELGYEPELSQLGWMLPVYVGATDEQAHEEAKPHFEYFSQRLQGLGQKRMMGGFPPGYVTEQSMADMLARKGPATRGLPYEQRITERWLAVGSAETVARELMDMAEIIGAGRVIPLFQFGDMPHQRALDSMARFGEHVLPRLREFVPSPRTLQPS